MILILKAILKVFPLFLVIQKRMIIIIITDVRVGPYRRLSAEELLLLKKALERPLAARRSNQLILKEINLEYS